MATIRKSSEECRNYIIENIEKYPVDIAKKLATKFNISRQAANRHIQNLVKDNVLCFTGNARVRTYSLIPQANIHKLYQLSNKLREDEVWSQDIKPYLNSLPDNVLNIWHYCFTEMFNNVIDHSEAQMVNVYLIKSIATTEIVIADNGVGIFKKIQKQLNLMDERHSVLELAKGKFTTDPKNHSGEGIFFSSRACDDYAILSGGVYFSHQLGREEDWIFEAQKVKQGTTVSMRMKNHTARKLKKIFDEFADIDYGFQKTVVPVALAQYGDEAVVSRSQAKRLLNRIDKFKIVILDFKGVVSIGQAFADEIFRVFANQHPEIKLLETNANKDILNMISRARQVNL